MTNTVNVGTAPNAGNGDTLRAAFQAINAKHVAIDASVQAGLNDLGILLVARGAWQADMAYASSPRREWVTHSGTAYVAATSHISGSDFSADLSAGKWLAIDVAQLIIDLSVPSGSSMAGFDWALLPLAINKIDWAIQTTTGGLNILRHIPPGEWPALFAGTSAYDCTAAAQAALNSLPNGGSLFLPKRGWGSSTRPSFLINSGLVLTRDDVTIYSDPIGEYSQGFYSNAAIDMLTIRAFGARLSNVAFWGNGSSTVFATTNGVVIDRTPLGDAETYSNLDANITGCMFFRLNDAVRGKGRNVFAFDNTFSECKRGVVGELHTYGGGNISDFRGWRVSRNRFHSCGGQYINAESVEALPANLAALDSWCIQMPQTSGSTSHLEIFNNNTDFCGAGFYKGYLAGAKISGNQTHAGTAIFVYAYITDAANQANCSNFVNSIKGNTINSRTADAVTDRGYQFSLNSIVAFGVSNLVIGDNTFHNSAQSHVLATACSRLTVQENTLSNGNMLWATDATQRPAMIIDQSPDATVIDNKVWSTIGTVYSFGITAASTSRITLRINQIQNATLPISVNVTDLTTSACDGLSWVLPTLQNSYVSGSQNKGFRRMFDGTVRLNIHLTGGTDNTVAFNLPVGYRPATPRTYPAIAIWTDGSDALALIEENGNVTINWNGAAAGGYHLNTTFDAA